MNPWQNCQEKCVACQRCSLSETRKHVVFGTGTPQAEVLLIGEAPGQNEDEQGEPFVGRGGQLLDVFLRSIGLCRQHSIYITNLVKCRPPQNRDPLPKEIAACQPWLETQLSLIQPKIVLCLGRVAAQVMIRKDFSVMKEHGQWFFQNGIWFTATLHPAALLRNPNNKPLAVADFTALQIKIDEICERTL